MRVKASSATFRALLWCACLAFAASAASAAKKPAAGGRATRDTSPILAVVNGVPVTENQLVVHRLLHGGDAAPSPPHEKEVDALVDEELMRQFLADRRVEVDAKRLALSVDAVEKQLEKERKTRTARYDRGALQREIWIALAWEKQLDRILTSGAIREEFDKHRSEYDGTEVRASQIFLAVRDSNSPQKVAAVHDKLAAIRAEIVNGKMKFADAARRNSEGPSRNVGGDLGYFPFHGAMPAPISRVIFALKPGEVSPPVRTSFGWHLYTVTDVKPGSFSLEDVRSQVIRRLSKELWDQLAAQGRKTAKIDRR